MFEGRGLDKPNNPIHIYNQSNFFITSKTTAVVFEAS